jgi:DNA/RNA endonuclease G (NUC1)
MSGKQSKKLRRKAETMLIDWLRTMTPDGEDQTKINKNNLHDFLPDQTHIFANNKFMLSYKQVKRNPNITLQDIL